MAPTPSSVTIDLSQYRGAIFDLDGVVTDTASLHREAWKKAFDQFLEQHHLATFSTGDYLQFVDGRPREDGVAAFLDSRKIKLPGGLPDDPPGATSRWAIANLKSAYFDALLTLRGAGTFASSVALILRMREHSVKTAVVTASLNCSRILAQGNLRDLFDVTVDGRDAAVMGLAGKPDPATFLEAARRLRVEPVHAVVFEDAVAGVLAARSGEFGLVIGVDRYRNPSALREAGSDAVVNDLAEVIIY